MPGPIMTAKQAAKIGGCLVDVQSANLMLKIRKKLNPTNLKKYDKLGMAARANMAWKMV